MCLRSHAGSKPRGSTADDAGAARSLWVRDCVMAVPTRWRRPRRDPGRSSARLGRRRSCGAVPPRPAGTRRRGRCAALRRADRSSTAAGAHPRSTGEIDALGDEAAAKSGAPRGRVDEQDAQPRGELILAEAEHAPHAPACALSDPTLLEGRVLGAGVVGNDPRDESLELESQPNSAAYISPCAITTQPRSPGCPRGRMTTSCCRISRGASPRPSPTGTSSRKRGPPGARRSPSPSSAPETPS